MNVVDVPILIVGAGPGGVGASMFLSKYGIHHYIIDKAHFPRDKVCGDAISHRALYTLEKANVAWLEELLAQSEQYAACQGIQFYVADGGCLEVPYPSLSKDGDQPQVIVAPRLDFDYFLFSKLTSPYCTILQGTEVVKFTETPNGIDVELKSSNGPLMLHTKAVIGADGDKSVVRKHFLQADAVQKTSSIGLSGYYKNVGGISAGNHIELHFLPELLPGYFWIFPLPNGRANVGVGNMSDIVRDKKINLRAQMLHAIANNPTLKPRFAQASLEGKLRGWGLPLAIDQPRLSGQRFMLVGDAGSLIDPFTGEGIGNALYSGMLAAQAVKEAYSEDKWDAITLKVYYDDVFYAHLGTELHWSNTLQRWSQYAWLSNYMVRKANKSKTLKEAIDGIFAGGNLHPDHKKLSFYLKILFNR